ncbi:MAG: RidA family protein [Alphaproteobacteria bacterium]|nr:RidA family protein [Alphaproteobacteria bacterium]
MHGGGAAMKRQELPDGTEITGFYVRTVKVGPHVFVSGTTCLDPKGRVVGRNAAEQTRATMKKIVAALKRGGADMDDITRLVIYCTDIRDGEAIIGEIARFQNKSRPASTLVAITALAKPGLLVEIEATATIAD